MTTLVKIPSQLKTKTKQNLYIIRSPRA